jgi:hypothetical protein
MSLHPYPDSPLPAVGVLLGYLRDRESVALGEVIHAAWHLAGYGLSYYDPHAPVAVEESPESEIESHLEMAMNMTTAGNAGALPWAVIARFAAGLLLRLLAR